MSDIDLAVSRSKRLEQLLEQKLGATGKGLHQKASSVEDRLPNDILHKLRLVATVRNKIVHEDDYQKIDDRSGFVRASDEAERYLKTLGAGTGGGKFWIVVLIVVIVLAVAAFLFLRR